MCMVEGWMMQVGVSRMFAPASCAHVQAYDKTGLHENTGNHT